MSAPVSPSGMAGGSPTPPNPGNAQFRVDQYIIEIQSSLTALWLECRDCKAQSEAAERKAEMVEHALTQRISEEGRRVNNELASTQKMLSQMAVNINSRDDATNSLNAISSTSYEELRRELSFVQAKLAEHTDEILRCTAGPNAAFAELRRSLDDSEHHRAGLGAEVQALQEQVRSAMEVQATHSVQLLPLVSQRNEVEDSVLQQRDLQARMSQAEETAREMNERSKELQEITGTHGSQILRLLDMGVDKWPEIKNDMVKIKADSTNLVRDVTAIKKEVADLRETSTRTWREIAGLHQDNAAFSSMARHAGGGGYRVGGPPSGAAGSTQSPALQNFANTARKSISHNRRMSNSSVLPGFPTGDNDTSGGTFGGDFSNAGR